jgi:branched-chain amino acid transport system ATP-binding protein
VLRLDGLELAYGDMVAVREASLEVAEGEFVALVGSNGAGKTTTLRGITGLLRPRRGTVELDGQRIDGLAPSAIVRRGIAHVPEGRQLFPSMTVRENLVLGAATAESRARRDETLIGRGLMSRPRLLLLDEPSLGLAPVMVKLIFENLRRINAEGVTVLLVEQNVRQALELSSRAYVLESGRIALSGPRDALLQSDAVKQAYLGL